MAKSTLQPQFFQTLVPGFNTHLMIPSDFFSKYIEGRSVEKTAVLKSDSSDITWKVKMKGRILSDGWRKFALAHSLKIGDVVLVRYEENMVFHVSYYCEKDIQPPSNNNDDGKSLLKKHSHPRTDVGDLPKKKRVKTNSNETETETPLQSFCPTESVSSRRHRDCSEELDIEREESSEDEPLTEFEKKKCNLKRKAVSYSSYSPCHKRFVTFTLPRDYVSISSLSLPKLFLRENGINKPGEVYLLGKDGLKLPTSLLRDNKGIMSLGKGWKDFVKANGLESGFTLKLIRKDDTTPVLSLCCPESASDKEEEEYFEAIKKQCLFIDSSNRDQISNDENNKEESRPSERVNLKEFVTLTITPSSVRQCRLSLLKTFTKENGINKSGLITLLGRDIMRHQTKLLLDKVKGIMYLGSGWIGFAEANGLNIGDSFTLKLIWEDTTPVLSLCPSSIDRETGGESSEENQENSIPIEESNEEETIKEEGRQRNNIDSSPRSQNRFMTITIRPNILRSNRMRLPTQFVMENNMNKPGMIYLLGKDDTKWIAKLVKEKDGRMSLGNGWTVFAEENDFKPGESVTLESIWEDETPMIRFLRKGTNSSKANKKESISMEDQEPRTRDSSSEIQDSRFATLTLTPEDVKACMLILPSQFLKANGINKLGKITILGENKMESSAYLLSRDGIVVLEDGWDEFCEANGVKLGESFTLEFINEQDKTSPVLKFCSCMVE